MTSAAAGRLRKSETDALCKLRVNWDRFEQRVGVLQVVEKYSWHFTCRDVQLNGLRQELLNPTAHQRNILLDFAQAPTLPIGPKQASQWWYANARFSVSCLGFYVFGEGAPAAGKYYMYLSRVLDHTPWYAIAALDHLNEQLPPMGGAYVIGVPLQAHASEWGGGLGSCVLTPPNGPRSGRDHPGTFQARLCQHICNMPVWMSRILSDILRDGCSSVLVAGHHQHKAEPARRRRSCGQTLACIFAVTECGHTGCIMCPLHAAMRLPTTAPRAGMVRPGSMASLAGDRGG